MNDDQNRRRPPALGENAYRPRPAPKPAESAPNYGQIEPKEEQQADSATSVYGPAAGFKSPTEASAPEQTAPPQNPAPGQNATAAQNSASTHTGPTQSGPAHTGADDVFATPTQPPSPAGRGVNYRPDPMGHIPHPQNPNLMPSQVPGGSSSGMAIASFIVGFLFILPIVPSALAIIFGAVALSNINRNPYLTGKGMAIAGIVLGILGLMFWAFIIISTM